MFNKIGLTITLAIVSILCMPDVSRTWAQMGRDDYLGPAVDYWHRYTRWQGPNQIVLRWRVASGALKEERLLDGNYFLARRSRMVSDNEAFTVTIRNPDYAAHLAKQSDGAWLMNGFSYSGEEVFDRYTRAVDSPWISPFRLAGEGAVVDLISSGKIVLVDAAPLPENKKIIRFRFAENMPESARRFSVIEVDAMTEFDWFPGRLHWALRRGSSQYTLRSSGFKSCDGLFVPTRVETLDKRGEDSKIIQELEIGETKKVDPKECFLEYYGLGELELPKKQRKSLDWANVVVPLFVMIAVIIAAIKMRAGKKS